jgi:glycerophosphoryl diester phosphodiesterase
MRVPLPPAFLTAPIAHRALHDRTKGRPENSLAAILAAKSAGYGIELDLQVSSDGVAMVFHDEDLDRLTEETGPVRAKDALTLMSIGLKNGAEGIPTLAMVLKLVAGRAPLLLEIKDQHGTLGLSDGRLEAATASALAGYDGPVALMSFNPHSIAEMARLCPSIPRGLTTSAFDPEDWAPVPADRCAALREIGDFDRVGASFISHEAADLDRPRVAEIKATAPVLCWTIASQTAETKARRVADNVTFEGYLAAIPA